MDWIVTAMNGTIGRISNVLLSLGAGIAAFALTLLGFLWLSRLDHQLAASLIIGLFALAIVRLAAERPNSAQARAQAALIDRLLAVRCGDLASPAPPALRSHYPELAAAVDGLFEQVRSTLDNVHTMALYDTVTELPNRIHFRREAEAMLAREPGSCAALIFIDLDGFKEVNDRLGHAQGDHTLAMVANRLRVVVKAQSDPDSPTPPLLARLAGDEFTILLPHMCGREAARRVADQALAALSEPFCSGGQTIRMGASLGVALAPEHGNDLTTLMKAADTAMYRAKGAGRSQVCFFEPAFAEDAAERARLERSLRRAVEKAELELLWEPQLCLRSHALSGAEAVPLWTDPDGVKRLSPGFIEIAEDSSLICEIGDWTLDTAAAHLAQWGAGGVVPRISLRVHRRQIEQRGFLQSLRERLAPLVAADLLVEVELELSGAAAAACGEGDVEALHALRGDGVSIALGDFGLGLCGLARLRRLPVQRLKLDPSLVDEVDVSDIGRALVAAAVHLARGLGCSVSAKGVTRPAQLELLRTLGCDAAQGPACAPPICGESFPRWARERDETVRLARAS